jgi:hypothetical protein
VAVEAESGVTIKTDLVAEGAEPLTVNRTALVPTVIAALVTVPAVGVFWTEFTSQAVVFAVFPG